MSEAAFCWSCLGQHMLSLECSMSQSQAFWLSHHLYATPYKRISGEKTHSTTGRLRPYLSLIPTLHQAYGNPPTQTGTYRSQMLTYQGNADLYLQGSGSSAPRQRPDCPECLERATPPCGGLLQSYDFQEELELYGHWNPADLRTQPAMRLNCVPGSV